VTPRVKLLLALLAVVLLGTLWSELRPARRQAAGLSPELRLEVGAQPARAKRGRGRAAEEPREVAELEVAALEPRTGAFEPGRNPFDFRTPPPPPPPPPPPGPSPEELARRAALEAERQAALAAVAEPPRPQPPPIDLSYLGSFGPAGRRVAVFRNGEGGLLNARVGDVLEGKFRLVAIGFESVDLEFVGFPDVPPEQLAVGEEGT
jgi:hypothetical protein